MIEIAAWIALTLLIVLATSYIAKRFGVVYMISMYVALILMANIFAAKIVLVGGRLVPASVIVYSSSFLLTDMLSEFYGKKTAQTAVWAGFVANIALVFSVWVALSWDPAPVWGGQESFEAVLGNTPRVVAASLAGYLVSQNHDVISYHFWKKRAPSHLWVRNNASTVVSQGLDTVIFITIAFYGTFPVVDLIIGQYLVKMAIALADTPFLYAAKKLRLYRETQDFPQ